MENKDYALCLSNVTKSYGNRQIINSVNLKVGSGEILTVVGPSGCGKSTLLRIIIGEEQPTTGRAMEYGEIIGPPDVTRGIVYQKYSLQPNMTVLDNVLLGKKLTSSFQEWRKRKNEYIDEANYFLELVHLTGHGNKYPHELSGGMQQRAAIAQSIIMTPPILVMDEPFGALDPFTRESMQTILIDLWKKFKMTIFFVTHDLEEAVYLGRRIIVLSQFYSDDNGSGTNHNYGAKIVADYDLSDRGSSTEVKGTEAFGDIIKKIRWEGFDPSNLQHVKEFNLRHRVSFLG